MVEPVRTAEERELGRGAGAAAHLPTSVGLHDTLCRRRLLIPPGGEQRRQRNTVYLLRLAGTISPSVPRQTAASLHTALMAA